MKNNNKGYERSFLLFLTKKEHKKLKFESLKREVSMQDLVRNKLFNIDNDTERKSKSDNR